MSTLAEIFALMEQQDLERKKREEELRLAREAMERRRLALAAAGAQPTETPPSMAEREQRMAAMGAKPQGDVGGWDSGLLGETVRNAAAAQAGVGAQIGGALEFAADNPWATGAGQIAQMIPGGTDAMRSAGEALRRRQEQAAETLAAPQRSVFDADQSMVDRVLLAASKTAAALPRAVTDIAGTAVTGGAAPLVLYGGQEYAERRDEGDSRLRAGLGAAAVALPTAALERIGAVAIVKPAASTLGRLGQGLRAANVEGVTEALQEPVGPLARAILATEQRKAEGDPWTKRVGDLFSVDTLKSMGEAYGIGAVIGGTAQPTIARVEGALARTKPKPLGATALATSITGKPTLDAESSYQAFLRAKASRDALAEAGADPADIAVLDADIAELAGMAGAQAREQLAKAGEVAPEPEAQPLELMTWDQYAARRESLLVPKLPGYRENLETKVEAPKREVPDDPVADLERFAAAMRPQSPLERLRAIASVTGKAGTFEQWKAPEPAPVEKPPSMSWEEYAAKRAQLAPDRGDGSKPPAGGWAPPAQAAPSPLAEVATTAASAKPWTRVEGVEGSAAMPDNPRERFRTRWVLAEADSLIPSHDAGFQQRRDFPVDMQTRNRAEDNYVEQVLSIGRDPIGDHLGDASFGNIGAPVVGPDGVVEAGNGRTMGVQIAYQNGTAAGYRAWLDNNASKFGFKPEQLAGMKAPVLVRERIDDVPDRPAFAIRLNADTQQRQTVAEVAKGDAMRMDDAILDMIQDSDLESPENSTFIKAFAQRVLGPQEIGGYFDKTGTALKQLHDRATIAVLAKAYPDQGIIRRLAMDEQPLGRRFARGLVAVAPKVAKYQEDVRAGRRSQGLEWSQPILQAAARFDAWQNDGQPGSVTQKADRWLKQMTLEPESPMQMAERELVSMLVSDPDLADGRKVKALGRVLGLIADRAMSVNPNIEAWADLGGGLFGGGMAQPQAPPQFSDQSVRQLYKEAQSDYHRIREAEERAKEEAKAPRLFSGKTRPEGLAAYYDRADGRITTTLDNGDVVEWKSSVWAKSSKGEVRWSGRGGVSAKPPGGDVWSFFPAPAALPDWARVLHEQMLATVERSGGTLRGGLAIPEATELNERGFVNAVREIEQSLRSVGEGQASAIAALWAVRARKWAKEQARPAYEMFAAVPVTVNDAAMTPSVSMLSAADVQLAASESLKMLLANAKSQAGFAMLGGVTTEGGKRLDHVVRLGWQQAELQNTVLHETVHAWWYTLSQAERDAFAELGGDKREVAENFVAVLERSLALGVAPAATTGAGQVLLANAMGHLRAAAKLWHFNAAGKYVLGPDPNVSAKASDDRGLKVASALWGTETLRKAPRPYDTITPPPRPGFVDLASAVDNLDFDGAYAALELVPPSLAPTVQAMLEEAQQQGRWPRSHELDDVIARTGLASSDVEAVDFALRTARARVAAKDTRRALELVGEDGPLFSTLEYQKAEAQEAKDAHPKTKASLQEPKNLPLWQRFKAQFTARGYLPQAVFDKWKRATWEITAEVMQAERAAGQFTVEIDRVAKLNGLRPTTMRRAIMSSLELGAVSPVTAFGDPALYRATMAMRDHIDGLTDRMLASPGMVDSELREVLEDNRGKYIHRTYRYHTDPEWKKGIEKSREWARAVEWWHDNRLFPGVTADELAAAGEDAASGSARDADLKQAANWLRAYLINGGLDDFGTVTGRKGGDRKVFWRRDNMPEQLRAVLGEERNPELAYVASVTSMVDALTKYETFSWIAKHFDGVVVARQPTDTLNKPISGAGFKPLSGQDEESVYLTRPAKVGAKVRLVNPGTSSAVPGNYVVVGTAEGSASAPHSLGGYVGDMLTVARAGKGSAQYMLPAQGFLHDDGAVVVVGGGATKRVTRPEVPAYYTTPEIAAWLEGDQPATGKLAAAAVAYLGLNAMVKSGKVVLSPATQARNFMSNVLLAGAAGLVTPKGAAALFLDGHNKDSWKLIWNKPAEISDWAIKAAKYGALSTGAHAADIEAYRRALEASMRVDPRNPDRGPIRKGTDKALGAAHSAMVLAEKFYQAGDSWWKLWAFRQWSERLAAANGRSVPNEADFVDAGERVNNQFPSYENTPAIVEFIRKFPVVGAYPTFPALATRALFAIGRQAAADMRSAVPGVRRMGVQTALGLTSTLVLPTAVPVLLAAALRSSDEDEDFVQRVGRMWTEAGDLQHIGGEFRRRNELVMLGREGTNVRFIDLSWLDPFNAARKPLLILLREALAGQDTEEGWGSALRGAVDAAKAPYLDLDIVFQTAVSLIANKRLGRTSGEEVYNPEDTRKALGIINYVGRQLGPAVSFFQDWAHAISGNPVGASGRVVSVSDALMATVGVRTSTTDLDIHLARSAFEYRNREQDAKALYKQDRYSATAKENLSKLEEANAAAKRIWDDLQVQVEASRRLGMTDQQIFQALTRSRIPPRRILGTEVFDEELRESVANLKALGVEPEQILGAMQDTGGTSKAPMSAKVAMRVLVNDWQPLKFDMPK